MGLEQARTLQGIGAAVVAPSSLSLLTANFAAGSERTRAVGYYGAVAGIGASLGLVVGGALADWVSWRAGFFINVPIGIAMIVAAAKVIPESPRATGPFDFVGALCSTLGMGALVFGIVNSADAGLETPTTVVAFVVAAVLLTLLVFNEWRAKRPIMPLHLFASRERAGAYAARIFFAGTMIAFFFFTTQFLQGVYHYSPSHQLGSTLGVAVLVALSAGAGAALADRVVVAYTGGAVMLAVALLLVIVLIVPPDFTARRAARKAGLAQPATASSR